MDTPRLEYLSLGELHRAAWDAECVRAGGGLAHHHRCRCGEIHEPTAEEAALIYQAAKRPGDKCSEGER